MSDFLRSFGIESEEEKKKRKRKERENPLLSSFSVYDNAETKRKDTLGTEVDNLKTRLNSQKLSREKLEEKEKGNFIERGLNLDPEQNPFFQALEIIDRPGDAVRTGIHEYMSGRSALSGAWDGFTGDKDTSGKDVNKILGLQSGNRVGDALGGFGTEVLLDPLTYGTFGLSGLIKGTANAGMKAVNNTKAGRKVTQGTKDTFNSLTQHFNTNAFTPFKAKELKTDIEGKRNLLLENMMQNTNYLNKTHGAEYGNNVQRLLEATLKENPKAQVILENLRQLGKYEGIGLRGGHNQTGNLTIGKGLNTLVNAVNTSARQTDKYKKDVEDINRIKGNYEDKIKSIINDPDKHYGGSLDLLEKRASKISYDFDINLDDLRLVKDLKVIEKEKKLDGFGENHFNTLKDYINVRNTIEKAGKKKEWAQKYQNPLQIQRLDQTDDLSDRAKQMSELTPEERLEFLKSELGNKRMNNNVEDMDALKTISDGLTAARLSGDRSEMLRLQVEKSDKLKELRKLNKDGQRQGFNVWKANEGLVNQGINQLKPDSVQNLVGDNVVIPRLQRELSNRPEDQLVADRMNQMQQNLREFGRAVGINIPNLDGYMRHALNEAYQNARTRADNGKDQPGFGASDSVIKTRKYFGSVEDINENMGMEFFETNAYKAFVEGIDKVSKYVAAQGFFNKALKQFGTKVKPENKFKEVPKGYVKIKPNDFEFYKVIDDVGKSHMSVKDSDEFIVPKGVANLMKNYSKMSDDMGSIYDTYMKYWKGFNLMTTGYHVRNVLGNYTNRYIAGMNQAQQVRYDLKSMKMLTEYRMSILPKVLEDGNIKNLSDSQKEIYNTVQEYLETGLRDSAKTRNEFHDFDKQMGDLVAEVKGEESPFSALNLPKKLVDGAIGLNFTFGNKADDVQRLGMYMWAKNNKNVQKQFPEAENPAAWKVREAMFDYNDLTAFENDIMRRYIMPFYTFARKNIEFQFRNFASVPHKALNVQRFTEATHEASGNNPEEIPEYHKEAFNMSNPLAENQMIKSYLPTADLSHFSNPSDAMDQFVSMLAPPKALLELQQNRDFFRERDIQEFEGQTYENHLGFNDTSPMMAHAMNQLFAMRNLDNFGQSVNSMFTGGDTPKWKSILSNYDPEKVKLSKMYDQRQQLYDLQKYFEQEEGRKLPTLSELEEALKGW